MSKNAPKYEPVSPDLVKHIAIERRAIAEFFEPLKSTIPESDYHKFICAWDDRGDAYDRRLETITGREMARMNRRGTHNPEDVDDVFLLTRFWEHEKDGKPIVPPFSKLNRPALSWFHGAMEHPERLRVLADVLQGKKPFEPSEQSERYRMLAAFAVLVTQADHFPTVEELRNLVFPNQKLARTRTERKWFGTHRKELGLILPGP